MAAALDAHFRAALGMGTAQLEAMDMREWFSHGQDIMEKLYQLDADGVLRPKPDFAAAARAASEAHKAPSDLHELIRSAPKTGKRVAVIGTGISGVQAMKCCLAEGMEPVAFEADNDIGGFWRFKENTMHPSVYRRSAPRPESAAAQCAPSRRRPSPALHPGGSARPSQHAHRHRPRHEQFRGLPVGQWTARTRALQRRAAAGGVEALARRGDAPDSH